MTLTIRLHQDDSAYWAEVVELPGCFASGRNLDELKEALQEAITLYLGDDEEGVEGGVRELRIDELRALV